MFGILDSVFRTKQKTRRRMNPIVRKLEKKGIKVPGGLGGIPFL